MRVGRLAGIPIGIHPLWLVIVGLITWSLGHDYFPAEAHGIGRSAAYALGLVAALGLFAGIVLHELGHAVVARRHGIEVEEIDLWLLGGVARLRGEARRPGDELRFAAAGPAVTAAIAAVLGIARLAAAGSLPDWGRALLDYELYVNGAILALNLMPAFPLDGGRILRSLLWRRWGDRERATAAAARGGRGFGWGMVALGAVSFFSGVPSGLWFGLLGWFLIVASTAEAQASAIADVLGDLHAGDLMSAPAASLPEDMTLSDAVERGFATHLYRAYPVLDRDQRAVGLITVGDVRRTPSRDRPSTLVGDVAHHERELFVEPGTRATDVALNPAFRRFGRVVVVGPDHTPVGVLSISDLEHRLRDRRAGSLSG